MKTETYYVKRGRRYVPAESVLGWEWQYADRMKVGTFRLAYAYNSGGARYEYDVTPDTAGWCAAAMLARQAMEQAIQDRVKATPQQESRPYTKRELAAREQAREILHAAGLLMPTWWQHSSSWEISEAAVKAVQEYRP